MNLITFVIYKTEIESQMSKTIYGYQGWGG